MVIKCLNAHPKLEKSAHSTKINWRKSIEMDLQFNNMTGQMPCSNNATVRINSLQLYLPEIWTNNPGEINWLVIKSCFNETQTNLRESSNYL